LSLISIRCDDAPRRVTSRLTVDLGALAHNYRALCDMAAPSRCAAVVKADAYGLGAAAVAPRLAAAGCSTFFVATVAEGIALRDAISDPEIYVLNGVNQVDAAGLAEFDLIPVISSDEQLTAWRPFRAHRIAVHVDTGMNRLGFDHVDLVAKRFRDFEVALLMTHLACADEPANPRNALQLARFAPVREQFAGIPTSIGNSAGTVLGATYRGDVCRPGIALYGGNPMLGAANPFRPVATLEAPILQLRWVPPNEPVGYGATGAASTRRLVATIGAGYADGILRALSGRGEVAVRGARAPIIGRVSMDLITIDVTGIADAVRVGDAAELVGAQVPLDDVANLAGTNSYELLTRLGRRSERRYTN
jgi:alanine racemase